jgi:hypothetical protein
MSGHRTTRSPRTIWLGIMTFLPAFASAAPRPTASSLRPVAAATKPREFFRTIR